MLLLLLLSARLRAGGEGWTEFLAAWRKGEHAPATLLVPKDRLTPAYSRSDEALLFLGATGDMGTQAIDGPALAGLREARSWKDGPHWILLGSDGAILDEGTDLPKGDYLQSRLRGAGLPSTWEALESFIREHPDHGGALQRRLGIATQVARRRLQNLRDQGKVQGARFSTESFIPGFQPAKVLGAELPAEWCREVADTLKQLNQVPDPWRLGNPMTFQTWLNLYRDALSPDLRRELAALNETVLKAWRCRPHSGRDMAQTFQEEGFSMGLGAFYMMCAMAASASEALPDLPVLTAAPGRFWPHDSLLMVIPWTRPDPETAKACLAFLDRLPLRELEAFPWNDSWSDWLHLRSYVHFLRSVAHAQLGQWQEAASAMQEHRRLCGKLWEESGPRLLGLYSGKSAPDLTSKSEVPAKASAPESFLQVLRLPPMEEIPPPPPPLPLRFLVWGEPDWVVQWEALRASASLAPWSSSELIREVPKTPDSDRVVHAGFPASGWAVFQGDSTLVARGDSAPDPALLAVQLRSFAPARIHLLDDFIAKHPEHLDARRDRLALIKARMPQSALEARYQEDAAAALLALDFGPDAPWISDMEGWRGQAKKVMPELEAIMQRWPDNSGLWRAWISWNAFLPKPQSVMVYAMDLPVFATRQGWLSMLPAPVQRAVAMECRKGRRFVSMVDWFEGAWAQVRARTRNTTPPQVDEREQAIYEGFREALIAVGRKAECAELDQEWATLQAKAKAAQESD